MRINERKADEDIKRAAYLMDISTMNIFDLKKNSLIANVHHDAKIDWLEVIILLVLTQKAIRKGQFLVVQR